jgi:predicted nucleic acid-binding protein
LKTFLDTSALAKRYIEEPGSAAVEKIFRETDELGLSIVVVPEMISALNRLMREKKLDAGIYGTVKRLFSEDIGGADIVELAEEVVALAISLIETNPIRALDAIQVASAIRWKADLFVTSDRRQSKSAAKAGLKTKFIK